MSVPSLVTLGTAVFSLLILPGQVQALTPDQIFDKVKNSVVVVKTLDASGSMKSLGSGVLLPNGKIATNCHVIKGGASYLVSREKISLRATLYAEDRDRDICILDAGSVKGKPVQLGKSTGLKVGQAVYAVGAPQGLELSLSDGIVAQLRGGLPPLIQTTAAISPGSSGGGLFDSEGRLIGLTTLYLKGGQSLNFAVPVEWIGDVKPGRQQAVGKRGSIEWLKRAAALKDTKDWKGLLDWCRKWTKSLPDDADAWFNLGAAYGNLKRYNDAIDAFHQALRIYPDDADAWLNLGYAYSNLKRHNDAIDAFHQALRIYPEYAGTWISLGIAYDDLKRYNDAIDAYRQALRINPDDAFVWRMLGHSYRGLKRHNDAIDAFHQALRINPEDAHAWLNIGIAYQQLKHHNDAIYAYRQALRINPDDADAWHVLGGAYLLSGNRAAALDVVKELRRLNPAMADDLFDIIVPR